MTHLPDSDLRELEGLPRAKGVGRDPDNEQCMFVYFERRMEDDELRALHELLARTLPSLIADLRAAREIIEGYNSDDPMDRLVRMTLDLLKQRGEFERLAKEALDQRDQARARIKELEGKT